MVNSKDKVRALAKQYGWDLRVRHSTDALPFELDPEVSILTRSGNSQVIVWFDGRQRVSDILVNGHPSGTTYRFLEQHLKGLG